MPFELPKLPYDRAALEPHMSARTLEFHHGKHHSKYVDKLNELVAGTPFEKLELTDVVRKTAGDEKNGKIFNNAAQTWNHTLFWNCMTPGGGGKPDGKIAGMIDDAFGGYDRFREAFVKAATGRFGSGWTWLVADPKGKLGIVSTPNAGNPLTDGKTCLLTCDVWEHAYYLDYQNERVRFVQAFLDRLVNWEYVNRQWEEERKAA